MAFCRAVGLAAALGAAGFASPVAAAGPAGHPKLDAKLNERASTGGRSRVIVTLKPGWDATDDVKKLGGVLGRRLQMINGQVAEVPNAVLRRLADNPAVESIHWDRPTGGTVSREAVSIGAREAQKLGYDGAGIGVAVIDSGVTALARRPDRNRGRRERGHGQPARRGVRGLRQRPRDGLRRLRPRHARRRHHRRQRLRLARRLRRHRPGGAHRQPEGPRRARARASSAT